MFGSNEMPSSESDVWKTAVIKKGVPEDLTETHINCWGWVEQRNFECWNFETTKPGMKMLSATIQWTSGSHCVEDLCQWTPKWSAGSLAVDSNVCWWLFYLFYGWYKVMSDMMFYYVLLSCIIIMYLFYLVDCQACERSGSSLGFGTLFHAMSPSQTCRQVWLAVIAGWWARQSALCWNWIFDT